MSLRKNQNFVIVLVIVTNLSLSFKYSSLFEERTNSSENDNITIRFQMNLGQGGKLSGFQSQQKTLKEKMNNKALTEGNKENLRPSVIRVKLEYGRYDDSTSLRLSVSEAPR